MRPPYESYAKSYHKACPAHQVGDIIQEKSSARFVGTEAELLATRNTFSSKNNEDFLVRFSGNLYLARLAARKSCKTVLTMRFLDSCHSSLPATAEPLYRSCVASFASALNSVVVIFFSWYLQQIFLLHDEYLEVFAHVLRFKEQPLFPTILQG